MPSDITLNSGTGGAIIRTDPTTSSEHVQVIKVAYGDTGTFNFVSTALPFPVIVTSSMVVQVLTSGTLVVTATAGTNPWSSAPGFNLPIVSVSSGLVQISGTPTVTATAGTNPWSSAPGFNLPIVSVSSGLIQISGTPTVTATAGTNPWSSAPGFNVPVVNVSSGIVQLAQVTSSGQSMFLFYTTGGVTVQNITTAVSNLKSYAFFNSSAAPYAVKVYNTTGPTIGSTTGMVLALVAPGSTGGGGANFGWPPPGPFSSNGWSIIPTASVIATSTDAPPSGLPINFTYQS